MRIRLLIDIETDDIARLQRYVEAQSVVHVMFFTEGDEVDWTTPGRFVGAKEAYDSVEEVAVAPDPKS